MVSDRIQNNFKLCNKNKTIALWKPQSKGRKRAGNSKSHLNLYGDARIPIHEKFIKKKDINPILIFLMIDFKTLKKSECISFKWNKSYHKVCLLINQKTCYLSLAQLFPLICNNLMGCVSNCDTDYEEFAEKPIGWQIPGKYDSSTKVELILRTGAQPGVHWIFSTKIFHVEILFLINNQNAL